MNEFLQGLNESQLEAVTHINGPIMIIAGAGSGKTKVLTTRIAYLMKAHQIDSFNILALTFTNKAAKEMKERIEKILGNNEARNLYIGTFHSVFARILRFEATKIGYPQNFTIYDTDDAKSVIKTVLQELHLDDKIYKPNTIYNRISSAKNALITYEAYKTDWHIQQEDVRANRPLTGKVYEAYVKRCFKNGAMDFDDLLLKFYELLKTSPEALSKYQHKFKYILIDEYQDTNPAQYEIIKLLGAQHENVCVVGDDAQSIYSFRGATIENILQFKTDYDDVKLVKLEQNYRSTKNIIQVANEIIKKNQGQIEKNLFTENLIGDKIKLVRTYTDTEEGKFIADSIQEQKLRYHFSNKDFSILYRTNAQSRSFEEALRRMNLPYIIYGGISFYQRKEIKDFLAYLRFVVNPNDEEALKRIINYPARGIGKTTIDKLILLANENNVSVWQILENASTFEFRAGTKDSIEEFVTMIKSFASMLPKYHAYDIAHHIGKQAGLVKELFNDKSTEGVARYENIQELLNSIKEWTDNYPNITEDGVVIDEGTSENYLIGPTAIYLQQITLLTDADTKDTNSDSVKLMTIHAAKGLEFSCVFVAGLEELLFPNAMSINTREELEEERRLFYVAITRAKQKLWLTYANSRYKFGNLVQNDMSRFINEIPENLLDKNYAGGGSKNTGSTQNTKTYTHDWHNKKETNQTGLQSLINQKKIVQHTPSSQFRASETKDIKKGNKIEHQRFGFGIITAIEGAAHNPIATILFDQNGEKKIMLNYARLRIVEE